jgi:uncharacterized protein involved in copper resistance
MPDPVPAPRLTAEQRVALEVCAAKREPCDVCGEDVCHQCCPVGAARAALALIDHQDHELMAIREQAETLAADFRSCANNGIGGPHVTEEYDSGFKSAFRHAAAALAALRQPTRPPTEDPTT